MGWTASVVELFPFFEENLFKEIQKQWHV